MSDEKQMIVVVEDDGEMSQAIERLLSAADYRASTFRSAEALIADDAAMAADCFIFDVHLPGESGFELRQRIALQGTGAPVIFITADCSSAAREQARLGGAFAIFSKPFSGQALLSTIANALCLRRARPDSR